MGHFLSTAERSTVIFLVGLFIAVHTVDALHVFESPVHSLKCRGERTGGRLFPSAILRPTIEPRAFEASSCNQAVLNPANLPS